MTTKICSVCKNTKDISEFRFRPDKNYYLSYCKICESNKNNTYNKSRPNETKNNRAKYYQNNKEKEKADHQQYRENNQEYFIEKNRNYYLNNKEEMITKSVKRRKEKRNTDSTFKLRENVSSLIRNQIKKNGKSFTKYLPYTIQELKQHLEGLFEPWMTWDNWGIYNSIIWDNDNPSTWTWQIDHIIPHSTFKYTSMEDQSFIDCWALSNLRPLNAKQNNHDGTKRIRHK